jgi:hypothetical protein
MKYESSPHLTIQKIWPMLKGFCIQTDRWIGQKLYAPDLSMWVLEKLISKY